MIFRVARAITENYVFPWRVQRLAEVLCPHLEGDRRFLDCGSSDGRLARELGERLHGEFVGCDVHVPETTYIPVQHYDGRRLPFATGEFDCVTMIDMLHHTHDPLAVLDEARRVSQRHVFIKDHYWIGRLEYAVLKSCDWISNKPFGIDVPYNFIAEADWNSIFQRLNMRIIDQRKFKLSRWDPCRHILFKLSVPA